MLKFSNFGKAKIGSAPSGTSGLSFTVEAGKGLAFPVLAAGDYFYGTFKDASGNREVVKIDARNSDAMTIAVGGRGLDGTTVRTWAAGDYFVAGLTNVALQETLSNANLVALGKLSSASDKLPYFTGAGAAAVTDFTPAARTLLNDVDMAAMRATLGVSTSAEIIPSGSVLAFFQAAAPVGWTKITTHDNKAIRIVAGAGGGAGGSVAFTTAFAAKAVAGTVGGTSLTKAQIPPHTHTGGNDRTVYHGDTAANLFASGTNTSTLTGDGQSGGLGAGGVAATHTHTFTGTAIDLAVQYIDMILCSKN